MTLDTGAVLPLYKQLTEALRREIEGGRYKKGEKIPTEQQLSKLYGVSRITVRNALEELTKDGLLVRKQGKGTFVSSDKLSRSIEGIRSFTDICRELGLKPGAKVIKSVIEDANAADLSELDLKPGSKVIVIERIRYADGVPVSLDVSHFPEQFSFLLNEDLNDNSMFGILKEKYQVSFIRSRKTIELIFASYEMSKYLNVSNGYPLLSISSLSCDAEGTPVHRSTQYIVGDKFKLIV